MADVYISGILADPSGDDVATNGGEYVTLKNGGTATADIGGWRLIDAADHVITIPSGYQIAPGATLRV